MFEAVLNPFAWWGLVAVSVPIIIHLINRLRYKKVQWAAMEFLLKAMQRHKRKLLMEQLLLLLLRCLLILLIVLLIVRPTWFLGGEGNEAGSIHHHIFVLDDSLSTHDLDDARRPDGTHVFRRGTQLLGDLAAAHAVSSGDHHWTILTWSNPLNPEFGVPLSTENAQGIRMTTEEATRLRDRFDELKPGYLALGPLPAVQEAGKYLDAVKEGKKHLHIVSDFRRTTWQAAGDEVYALLADLSKTGKVRLQFHDLARPERGPTPGEVPASHGNLGITTLVPKPRRNPEATTSVADLPLKVVTPRLPFDVHVTVRNFGTAEHSKVRLMLRSDGMVRGERLIDRLAGGEERTFVFALEYAVDEPPGIKALSAKLEDTVGGDFLAVDDVCFGFIELRSKVPVLLIDPEARNNDAASDWLFVASALTGSARTGVHWDVVTPRELTNRKNLSQYAVIYVLNVAGVGRSEGDLDEEGVRNLERYARNGGSLAFFLGPRTNVASFNERLYQKGTGIFPVPLLLRPDPEGRKNLTYIDDEPDKDDFATQLRFLKPHPAFPFTGDIADTFSRYIHVNRYFRVDPQWKPGQSADMLVQLANRRPLTYYSVDARRIANELNDVAGAVSEGKLKQFVGKIAAAVEDADKKRARKGELIDALTGALGEPAATEFWKDKKHAELHKRMTDFLALLQQGDPLVIEANVQGGARAGRVMVFLTPAAPTAIQGKNYAWQDMATGDLGQFFFVPMILGVQEHLASQTRAAEFATSALVQAQPLELRLDKDRFNPVVEVWFQKEGEAQPSKVDTINAERVKPLVTPPLAPGAKVEDQYEWLVRLRPVQGPGHYRLRFNQVGGNLAGDTTVTSDPGKNLDTAKIPEERPLAFIVDGRQEGDLTRISEDQLRDALADGLAKGASKTPPGEAREYVQGKNWFVLNALESQANEALQNQTWSDYSWVLLAFVALLLLEQFLAMKFSHHVA
jgi:hypothetical protein